MLFRSAFVDGGGASALASMAVNAVKNSDALQGLGSAFDGAAAKGHAFISTQERATAATKASADAAKQAAAAQKELVDAAFAGPLSEIADLNAALDELRAAWDLAAADAAALTAAQDTLNAAMGLTPSRVEIGRAHV